MDKDRVEGLVNVAKGKAKVALGKLTGDAKLRSEGEAEKIKGKLQNAVGGVKDAIEEEKTDKE